MRNDGAPLDARTALAGLYLASEQQQMQDNPKLPRRKGKGKRNDSPRAEIDELWDGFYMVATYCFDLQRKMNYVCKLTREFVDEQQLQQPRIREAAKEIWDDQRALEDQGRDWKKRAEKAEEIIIRLYREIGEEHADLLRRAAGEPKPK